MNPHAIEIDVHAVKQLLDSGSDFLLIDCRDPHEHRIARIAGAVLVPMRQAAERLSEIEPYRAKPIVVHCHHGGRSLQVANWLRGHGFVHAQSMTGGIDQWSDQIDPNTPKY